MGLLDDAIKEHLELKRRRGADAGEISRLESEALGPVPRSAEGVPDMSDTSEPAPTPEPEHESGGLFSRLRGGRRSKHEPEPAPPPLAAPEPDPEAYEPPPVPRPSYDPPPAPVEHEPDIVPADDEPDGEDLLEETPEF